MNCRSECKMQNYETSKDNIGENLEKLKIIEFDNVFLEATKKTKTKKKKPKQTKNPRDLWKKKLLNCT